MMEITKTKQINGNMIENIKSKKAIKEEINLNEPKLEWNEEKECKDTKLECKVKVINLS